MGERNLSEETSSSTTRGLEGRVGLDLEIDSLDLIEDWIPKHSLTTDLTDCCMAMSSEFLSSVTKTRSTAALTSAAMAL